MNIVFNLKHSINIRPKKNIFKYLKSQKIKSNQLNIEKHRFTNVAHWIFLVAFVFVPIIMGFSFSASIGTLSHEYLQIDPPNSMLLALTLLVIFIQTGAFLYLIFNYPRFLIHSGMIILCYFQLFVMFLVPLIIGFASDGNVIQILFQDFSELSLVIYAFFACTALRTRFKSAFSKTKSRNNWTYILFGNNSNKNEPTRDYLKIFLFPIIGFGFVWVFNWIFNFNVLSGFHLNSSNQDSLDNLLKTTNGKLVGLPLIILIAPITEEISTRHAIIAPSLAESKETAVADSISNNISIKTASKPLFWISLISAMYYFASMHIAFQLGAYKDILGYIGTSIALSLIFVSTNGVSFYNISTHSLWNIFVVISMAVNGNL